MSPNKKVTKEVGIGKALSVSLPRAKPPFPMYPTRHALGVRRSALTGKTCFLATIFTDSGGAALAALPICFAPTLRAKKSEHFLPEQDVG